MISPNWYPGARQLRQFAVISFIGFGLLGLMVMQTSGSVRAATTLAAIGTAVMLVGLVAPDAIRIVYVLLTAITLPIGWLVSGIVLRLIFYSVVTPVGLVFRLIGRDLLRRNRLDVASYWQKHKQRSDPLSYYRQA